MATISRDTVRVEITAVDKTKSGFRSLTSGLDNVQKTARRLQTTLGNLGGRRLLSGIRSVSRELTSIAGLGGVVGAGGIAAGFGLLARNGLIAGDSIAKTSDKLGVATEELTKLQFAVSQTSEVTEKSFNIALQRMTRRIAEAEAGNVGLQGKLADLGLTVDDFAGKSPDQAFLTLADAISEVGDQNERVRLTFAFFDSEGVGLVNTLQQGSQAIRDLGGEAEALGLTFDRISLAKIEQANDSFGRIRDVIKAASIAIAVNLAPVLTEVTGNILEFVRANGGIGEIVQRAYISATEAIQSVRASVTTAIQFFDRLSDRINNARLTALRLRESLITSASGIIPLSDEAELNSQQRLLEIRQGIANIEIPGVEIDTSLSIEGLEALREKLLEVRNSRLSEDSAEADRVFQVNQQAINQINELIALRQRLSSTPSTATGQAGGGGSISGVDIASILGNQAEAEATALNERQRLQDQAAQKAAADQLARDEEAARAKQAREAQQAAEQLAREQQTARSSLRTLRETFDERIQIANEAQDRLDNVASISRTIGIDSEIENGLIDSIIAEERRQLDDLDRAREEEFSQRQERRSSVLNLSSLIEFDTSTFQTVENGADEIARVFRERVKAINVSVDLSSEEKLDAIREAAILREQLKDELQVDVTVNRLTSAADLTGQVLGGFGQLQQSGVADDSQLAQERANQIAQIQSDLNTAIEAGNQAEIASQQSKLSALKTIQSREQQIAKKRFENYKKTQKAIALVSTFSAAAQVFQETPGILPIRILAASAAVAAGLANIQAIDRQQFNSGSAGSGSFGSASGTGGVSNSQVTNTAAQTQTQTRPTVINLVANPDLPLSYESVVDLVERINEVGEDGVNVRTVAA